jgi:hypothetical protein
MCNRRSTPLTCAPPSRAPCLAAVRVQLRAAAKHALQRHQWLRARVMLDEALELAPNSAPLYRLRIIASAGLGDFESALEGAACPASGHSWGPAEYRRRPLGRLQNIWDLLVGKKTRRRCTPPHGRVHPPTSTPRTPRRGEPTACPGSRVHIPTPDSEALLELQPSPDAFMYKGHALYHLRDFAAAVSPCPLHLRSA